tara:strand:- start:8633 stop:9316 length:684 start_codon:yes stop_codon:yes gene_type:complete
MLRIVINFFAFFILSYLLIVPNTLSQEHLKINYFQQIINSKNCLGVDIAQFTNKKLYLFNLDIKVGTYYCLKNLLKEREELIINNSNGGSFVDAYYLSEFINDNNIKVKITKNCLSACTILLASSKNSQMCTEAKLGLHSVGFYNSEDKKVKNFFESILGEYFSFYINLLNNMYIKKMVDYGVNYYHVNTYTNSYTDRLYKFNGLEAKKYGYVKKTIRCKSLLLENN